MTIPPYQEMMLPLLKALGDGAVWSRSQLRDVVVNDFQLSEEDQAELIPTGKVSLLQNRTGWAVTYMFKAKLLSRPKRAHYSITDRGREVLEANPSGVNNSVLKQFPEFQKFSAKNPNSSSHEQPSATPTEETSSTPEERLEAANAELERALIDDLIERILEKDWKFFEILVLDVLRTAGYGGPTGETQHLGGVSDEGVDGVIREDALGLDLIYVQAKRWTGSVNRPDIQQFVGALQGQGANKGIFITTSTFSSGAVDYAAKVPMSLVLIDGHRLAKLMMAGNVGVSIASQYSVKRIDLDYFQTEDLS